MDCPICIERMETISTLHCGHRFHTDCINAWKSTGRQTCPICRGEDEEDNSKIIARAVHLRDAEILRLTRKKRDLELENIKLLIQLGILKTKLRNQEKEIMKDILIAAIGLTLIGMSLVFKLH